MGHSTTTTDVCQDVSSFLGTFKLYLGSSVRGATNKLSGAQRLHIEIVKSDTYYFGKALNGLLEFGTVHSMKRLKSGKIKLVLLPHK